MCLLATSCAHSQLFTYSPAMKSCVAAWNKSAPVTNLATDQTEEIELIEEKPFTDQINVETAIENISASNDQVAHLRNNQAEVFISQELTNSIEPLVVYMLFNGKKRPQHYALQIATILTKAQKQYKLSSEAQKLIDYAINTLNECGKSTICSLLMTQGAEWKKLKGENFTKLLSKPLLEKIDTEFKDSLLTPRLFS